MSTKARPSGARAPRVPAEQARRQIIEATTRMLQERRFRDLTVDEVMHEAGLPRTVFYRHFAGLSDVVLGLLDDLMRRVLAEADVGDPHDRLILRRQLALVVETFRSHGRLLLAFDEAAHHDDDVERAYRAWIEQTVELTAQLLQQGVREGHTPPLPALEVARALAAMNARYLLELVDRDPAFDVDAAIEALWTVWSRTTWP
jgi:AcrR family transcriptional regulator